MYTEPDCVNGMGEEARGEIGLSGSIIAAIKPRRCSSAHNQSCGGKLTAE